MRLLPLLLAALLVPTAFAAPPMIERFSGEVSVRVFLAHGTTVCADTAPAELVVSREMETATFVLTIATACANAFVFRGVMTPEGWRFQDADTGAVSGGVSWDPETGDQRLQALVDTCPSVMICEFSHGVRLTGLFGGATVLF